MDGSVRIYPDILGEHTTVFSRLSREAYDYLFHELDAANTDGIRHAMRHLFLPAYLAFNETGRRYTKEGLQWTINCATQRQLDALISADPDMPFWPVDGKEREWFIHWWEALFGDEEWRCEDICREDVDHREEAPRDAFVGRKRHFDLSPEVVNFPRTDGLPPGHGAPPPDRVFDDPAPQPPRRPTDAARFFRWEDQATALETAKGIHARSGQLRVWVEFDWPVGEGYFVGGDVYRRTNWACVRFFAGKPVDSYPDLRKGWTQEEPEEELEEELS